MKSIKNASNIIIAGCSVVSAFAGTSSAPAGVTEISKDTLKANLEKVIEGNVGDLITYIDSIGGTVGPLSGTFTSKESVTIIVALGTEENKYLYGTKAGAGDIEENKKFVKIVCEKGKPVAVSVENGTKKKEEKEEGK